MKCWKCAREIEVKERVGFRDHCPGCDRALHACLNCEFYDVAYNNQCRETQAERVVDKDARIFAISSAPARVQNRPRCLATLALAQNLTSSSRKSREF